MNRRQLIILGAAGAFLLSAGASAEPQMTTDMAHDVNFADYKTFSWASIHPQGGMNSVQYQEIMNSITTYMTGKGYQRNAPGDLTMALTLGLVIMVISSIGGLSQNQGHRERTTG
jgi:hypothetical protein